MIHKLAKRMHLVNHERVQERFKQIKWIYYYAKKYWMSMILYTLIGMVGTVISLVSSWISKDLDDIMTGYDTGRLVTTFCMMIGINIGTCLMSQISKYVSSKISMKVDADVKADIF